MTTALPRQDVVLGRTIEIQRLLQTRAVLAQRSPEVGGGGGPKPGLGQQGGLPVAVRLGMRSHLQPQFQRTGTLASEAQQVRLEPHGMDGPQAAR